jgi:hypothetical protein
LAVQTQHNNKTQNEQNKTKQNKTKQNKTKQNKTKQNKTQPGWTQTTCWPPYATWAKSKCSCGAWRSSPTIGGLFFCLVWFGLVWFGLVWFGFDKILFVLLQISIYLGGCEGNQIKNKPEAKAKKQKQKQKTYRR